MKYSGTERVWNGLESCREWITWKTGFYIEEAGTDLCKIDGVLRFKEYRNEYQLVHWPKQLYLSHPLEKLLEIIDPMDRESLLEHPDDVIESDFCRIVNWEPFYLPEDI